MVFRVRVGYELEGCSPTSLSLSLSHTHTHTHTHTSLAGQSTLILASDGLWDVLSNEQAVAIALQHSNAETAAKALVIAAFRAGSVDNITAVVCHMKI
jgi:serine/threonine protein phosphatase PrpC